MPVLHDNEVTVMKF